MSFFVILYYGAEESAVIYAPVAQPVEHLTFNQGVRDSNSRRSTKRKSTHNGCFFFWCFC